MNSNQLISEYLSESMSPSTVRRGAFHCLLPAHGFVYLSEDIMDTKVCSTCKKEKRLTEFHKNKTKKDGLAYQCKVCVKLREESEEIRKYRLKYLKSEKGMAVKEKYSSSEDGRRAAVRATKKYDKNNPLKRIAQNKLNGAVRFKKIKRMPCEVCGSISKIHGHHKDYDKPLEVIWLCRQHHAELHKEIKT